MKKITYGLIIRIVFLWFGFQVFESQAQVPTVQDCLGAIPVCTDTYNQPLSFQGTGNYPDEINPNQTCPRSCMDGEKNSVWYVISVKSGGLLRFVITPVSSSDDYDWAVYNLNQMECSDIYNNAIFMQASCNAAGGPGFQGATGISTPNGGYSNCSGGGNTNKWNADLQVNAGDTYVLCVSNWTMTQSGYLLDFSESTADIFDDVPAVLSSVNTSIGCAGATSLEFVFSENVRCLSVQPSDFLLIGPDGTQHIVNSVSGAGCAAGGEQEKFFTIGFYPPMYLNGTYSLQLVGEVTDLCSNATVPHNKEFDVTLDPLPTVLSGPDDVMVPIGGAATFSVETLGDTSFQWQYRPNSTAFWQNLSEAAPYSGTTTNLLTIDPATFDLGQYQFRCTVSGNCPPPTQSAAATLFVGDQLAASATAEPEEICFGNQSQLNVTAFGGNTQQPYSYLWTAPGGYSSTQQNPTVEPFTTTTYTCVVDDGYNPYTTYVTVTVHPLPVAEAGFDQTINHGTFTTLQGVSISGQDPFTYSWQPSDSLWDPSAQNPATRKLRGSTMFELVVTDGNNCVSEPDQVLITVIGGPLAASPIAQPAAICLGDTAQLFALPSGGEYTSYTFTWSRNGEDVSSEENPKVWPVSNTTYTLTLFDGFNTVSRPVTVTVNELPKVELTQPGMHLVDGVIQNCVYDTLVLDAGADTPGLEYFWKNGATSQSTAISTSGLSFDLQSHWVRVTNPQTKCVATDTVDVMFTFIECSYGIDDLATADLIRVFPNPAGGEVTISIDGKPTDFEIAISELSGKKLFEQKYQKTINGVANHTISLCRLNAGAYLIKVASTGGIIVKKLIVIR